MSKEKLTLEEAENIVDNMYQNRWKECGVEDGNTIHMNNLEKLHYSKLERASILLLRTEIRLKRENQELKKQLEYLRSGEYLDQLKFERNMLEDVVNKGEVSKEDKEFIDMTHRNTELLEQQKEFIEWLENLIGQNETVIEVSKYGLPKECSKLLIDFYKSILSKFKEIIGKDINVGTEGDDKKC